MVFRKSLHTCARAAVIFLIFDLCGPAVVGCGGLFGPSGIGPPTPYVLDLSTMDEAETPQEAFYAARAQYLVLLAYVNAYAKSPTADQEFLGHVRMADLEVQKAEGLVETALSVGDLDLATSRLQLMRSALLLLRSTLAAGGL